MSLSLRCFGCGATPEGPYPFACPERERAPAVDHVVRRHLAGPLAPPDRDFQQPFLRYRHRLASWHRARALGWSDADFIAMVEELDAAVAAVDGAGFAPSRVKALPALAGALNLAHLEAKLEARGVSGSHKARHLFGIALHLKLIDGPPPRLAIASCGNAALAAAVVARAGGWPLQVFIPPDAPAAVVARLEALEARIEICPRAAGQVGDASYRAFRRAVAEGALPFCCQGPDNGLTIEGGMTLAYEWAEQWAGTLGGGISGPAPDRPAPDHLLVQVGGGALASAVGAGLAELVAAGALARTPRLHPVQTWGAWPLERALGRLAESGEALSAAVRHRGDYMWPWEAPPHSLAHGILDDETYDWVALAEQVIATGGRAVRASEDRLRAAHALARVAGVRACVTGAAGLAGALTLAAERALRPTDRVALIFSGADRGEVI